MMSKLLSLFLASLIAVNPLALAISDVDKQELPVYSVAQNGGFENSKNGWSATGGTFTISTSLTNVAAGKAAASWDSSAAAQEFRSATISVPQSLAGKNGLAYVQLKNSTATATHLFQLYNVTASAPISSTTVVASAEYAKTQVTFVWPAAGTNVRLQLVSVAANEPAIFIDDVFAGLNTLVNAQSTQYVGQVFSVSTTSCPTGSVIADGSALSRAVYSSLFTAIGITHGQGDGSTTFNVPDYAGRFLRGRTNNAARDPDFASRTAMNTGGNTGANVGSIQADEFASHNHNYTTNNAPPLNFSLGSQPPRTQDTGGATASTQFRGGNETRPKNAFVTYCVQAFPQSASFSAELSNWRIDASINGIDFSTGSGAVVAYSEMTAAAQTLVNNSGAGVISAEIACASGTASTGTTCSSNESNGIAFIPPTIGDAEVCAIFNTTTFPSGTTTTMTFQLAETTNTSSAIVVSGQTRSTAGGYTISTRADFYDSHRVCDVFPIASFAKKTFRLEFIQGASPITTNRVTAADSGIVTRWTVRPLTQNVPAPVFIGSVTSGSGGSERVERARIDNGASITSQSGAWLTSVSRPSTGQYNVVIATGIFSAIPTCVCTVEGNAGATCDLGSAPTLTSAEFRIRNGLNADTNNNFTVICMGPR